MVNGKHFVTFYFFSPLILTSLSNSLLTKQLLLNKDSIIPYQKLFQNETLWQYHSTISNFRLDNNTFGCIFVNKIYEVIKIMILINYNNFELTFP